MTGPGRGGAVLVAVALTVAAGCASTREPRGESAMEEAARFNVQLGAGYLRSGDLKRANTKLEKALRQDPDNARAHATYALLNMQLDKPDKARQHFERALEIDPDSPDLKNNYGTFLCEHGDYDSAIAQFVEAAENRLYRTPAYAYTNAGRCARQAARPGEARRYLRRALEINPNLGSALYQLAALELERGRPAKAKQYFERYTSHASADARSLWLGVRIERALGNRQGARDYGVQLLRNHRDSRQAERFLETR